MYSLDCNLRDSLIKNMEMLENQNINCKHCSGLCCTSQRNSMMISPNEALDIVNYLYYAQKLDHFFIEKLNKVICDYRLNLDLPISGKKSNFRRYYTCPFYKNQNLGCELPENIKPMGCLAYNPSQANESKGLSCKSNTELLKSFTKQEIHTNTKLSHLSWEKQSIPMAVKEIIDLNLRHKQSI